jgi:hypothetical protein
MSGFASVPPQPWANMLGRCIRSKGHGKRGQDHATEVSDSVAGIGRHDLGLIGRQRARGQRAVP